MATLRELIIKISANSQSFQSEIQRASRMGSEYYRTLQNGGRQAAAAAREQRRALAELHSQLTEIRASAVGMTGAFAGAFATGHLISLADEWSSVNARLKQASQSSDEFSSSQKVLMDISQRTGTAFSDNAALFARSASSPPGNSLSDATCAPSGAHLIRTAAQPECERGDDVDGV
ncbi:exopolyphosphatase [Escherichia coli]|uniref:exopolyphosphatase n=1 Tax=Escherichia coli TaxID=562 RepID=UPI0006A436BA|nr:tail component of prophage CP-933X [Escherichia coli]